jgi:hypothetical protein
MIRGPGPFVKAPHAFFLKIIHPLNSLIEVLAVGGKSSD